MFKGGTLKDNEGNKIYPNAYYKIGDLFITTNNENPANRFGGTWEKLPDETFLMTASSKYAVKSTGGENEHTLTIAEMPAHTHGLSNGDHGDITINGSNSGDKYNMAYTGLTAQGGFVIAKSTGGGQPHNNMPKFYAVYVWIRVA